MERDILKKSGGHLLQIPEMKYRVIHETAKEHKNYSILKMCRILNVSRSGYYHWCKRGESPLKKKDRELKS